ncbi:MAG: DNA polymerase II [Candidatus Thermoplasmatota archaeon]|nr:DNA polymerase II [Candidatus Thermoplasmatota archaeon]
MGTWDIRLIGASYKKMEGDLAVHLYGKTADGRSVTVRYTGFEPYFYVAEPPADVVEMLLADDRVRRLEDDELLHKGEKKKCKKVVVTFPWLVPDIRKTVMPRAVVLAADIPFHFRFVYDKDLESCVRVLGEEVHDETYRTDVVVQASGFEQIRPFHPDLTVLSFDIETSLKEPKIFCICCVVKKEGKLEPRQFDGDGPGGERRMIEDFSRFIIDCDPDVITGYNIDGFDIPQIIQRAQALGLADLSWGRYPGSLSQYNNRFWWTEGRIIVDAWWAVKKILKPKQETLNAVAKLLLGKEKHDVDPKKMDEEWAQDKVRVKNYCEHDSVLALNVLERVAILQRSMDLATVSKLPLDDVVNGTTSQLVDSILIRDADREKVAVPMTMRGGEGVEMIEGGYVHEMTSGLYHWVLTLDFRSMYPSMIISKNICFTTLDPNGTVVSPTGARFLDKRVREGLLPRILVRLMEERASTKKAMKDARTAEEREYYNGLQEAIKILMNSFYGVLASSFYRFTDPKIGASITAFAREATKDLIKKLESEGLKVIYSDTDSVFFLSPYPNLEESVALGQQIAERFSSGSIVLEFEKIMEPFFSHGMKKRYVGRMVWPRQELIVRGYEMRRTDSFDLQSEVLASVFEKVLDGDQAGAVAYTREVIDALVSGKVDPAKLVISRSVRDESQYKQSDSMINVRVARKLKELGYEVVPGMKVSWIVTDSRAHPQKFEPWVEGRPLPEGVRPDCKYYATRLAATIARVTDSFGWDEKSLVSGVQQSSLFNRDFENKKRARVTPQPKKTDKKLNLDDFM